MMEEYILRINDVTKQFKNFTALNQVRIQLKQGKIYGLIGKNGAGKTTLMRLITGLSYPTQGSIELFGENKEAGLRRERKRVGSLIEYPALDGNMTAKENMKLHRIIRGIPNKTIEDELLQMVGLGDTKNKKVKDFSLGMRQRLGIAIAMIGNPELLILDEPVNGLDPVGVVEIRNLIKRICEERNITILISSHNLPELYQTATDYIIIDKGRVCQTLTLPELEKKCSHHLVIECDEVEKLVQVFETKLQTTDYRVLQDGSVHLDGFLEDRKYVMKTIVDSGIIPTKFAVEGDTLENYYLPVIGGKNND